MTGSELLTNLNNRIEDSNNYVGTVAHKLEALNDAQKTLTILLRNYYLSDLKVKATSQTITSGELTFTDLFSAHTITGVTGSSPTDGSPTVFTKTSHGLINGDKVELSGFTEMVEVNGIIGIVEDAGNGNDFKIKGVLGSPAESTGGTVTKINDGSGYSIRNGIYKVYDKTNNRIAKLVEEADFPLESDYPYGSVYCVSDNKILINPSSCVSADVYYIKIPTAIANTSVECELNSALEPVLLDLAESTMWYADNRQGRGDKAYQRAVTSIQTLNERLDV
tara:strand:- start:11391 stop:12227 length:837 start_codon:yes stop_codon:yes gene_type:complete